MKRIMAIAGAACVLGGYALPAAAEFPEKAVTVVIPFAPGGGTDTAGRMWAKELEQCLGGKQPVIVQNRPGAGGQIGFAEVAKAKPDGYTLIGLNQPNVQIGAITKPNPTYTMDSFDYLANFTSSRTTLSVLKDSPIQSISALIAEAKKSGTPINVGISGIGSDDHQLLLKLKRIAGVDFKIVPFGDSAGAQTALLGGHTPMATVNTVSVTKFSDQIRALAVSAETRVPDLPDVPTFKEQGFDIVNGSTHSIGGPKGIEKEARDKLTGCFEKIGKDEKFMGAMRERGLIPTVMNAEETRAFVMKDYETLKAIWESEPWEQ